MPEHDDLHPQLAELLRDSFGAQAAMVLYTAVKLDLAEHLAASATTAERLAQRVGADPRGVQRILRALASRGVCEEAEEGLFRLTDLGACLRHGHPNSIRARVLLNVEVHQALWAGLPETVRTGESASLRVYGLPFYDYLAQNRAAGEVFDRAMSSAGWIRHRFRAAIEAYDFGRFRSFVDVGGGNGAFLAEILKDAPGARGTVCDLPRLESAANEVIAATGLADRCRFVAVDAFAAVPGGADVYVLSNFLNSWSDDDAQKVLRSCREAMQADARLLVIDWVLPGAGQAAVAARSRDAVTMDLVMLSCFGADRGRIRTFGEFRELLAAAGFSVAGRFPTRASVEVIEARRDAT